MSLVLGLAACGGGGPATPGLPASGSTLASGAAGTGTSMPSDPPGHATTTTSADAAPTSPATAPAAPSTTPPTTPTSSGNATATPLAAEGNAATPGATSPGALVAPPAGSERLRAGLAVEPAPGGPIARLVVLDSRTAAGDVRLVADLGSATPDRWAVTQRWEPEPGAGLSTWRGDVQALFLRDGQLWRALVPADAQAAATEVPVSLAARVCRLMRVHEIDPVDGLDAWVEIEHAGPDARCDTVPDNAGAWVRLSDARWAPVPEGTTTVAALRTPAGRLQSLLVHEVVAARLALLDADSLQARDEVAGATAIEAVELMAAPLSTASGTWLHLRVNGGQLRRLHSTGTTARLGPEQHDLRSAGATAAVHDGTTLYFGDGANLWRWATAAAAAERHAVLPAEAGEVTRLAATDGHLLVTQGSARPTLWTVSKSVGSWAVRLGGGPADPAFHAFVGHQGDTVVYVARDDHATAGHAPAAHRVYRVVAGQGPSPATRFGVALGGVVVQPTLRHGQAILDGLLYCVPAPGSAAGDCRGGTLSQLALADGASIELGRWPLHATLSTFSPLAWVWSGSPGLVMAHGHRVSARGTEAWTDLWSMTPGVAGSLRRITAGMP
jgi:hypothetical protein